MADDRLFDVSGIPEIPLFREPRRAKAARGATLDGRFRNDYPPDWDSCRSCIGTGHRASRDGGRTFATPAMKLLPDDPRLAETYGYAPGPGKWEWVACPDCLGMGSIKARARFEASHRCERCGHPYMPKGDAKMLGVEPTPYRWSPCDARCTHVGPIRYRFGDEAWCDFGTIADSGWAAVDPAVFDGAEVEAEWRILTVHHLDGDKANCRWWNLAALCQRCHLEIQAKVVLERVYPHEHSHWFKLHAAAWYAFVYLGEDLDREAVAARRDELLALERMT